MLKRLLLLLVPALFLAAVSNINPTWGKTGNTSVTLVSSNGKSMVVEFSIPSYQSNKVQTSLGEAIIPEIENGAANLVKGFPALPHLSKSIIIPDVDEMQIRVIDAQYTDIENVLIAPSKGNLKRNQDPNDMPYTFGAIYKENAFFPKNIANLQEPYIFRDFRGQAIQMVPFQYNPVTRVLRVYTSVKVEITPTGQKGKNIFSRISAPEKIDNQYAAIYDRHFLNASNQKYTPLGEDGKMLVIIYGTFAETMQPFIDWKIQKGQQIEMVNLSTVGTTASAIKTYITNYYNNNGLTFVLLVGDAEQIPSLNSSGDSDVAYGYITGNDAYPEVMIGRFSGANVNEIATQVARTVNYEKTPMADAVWYSKYIGIGSEQGEGQGDDGEADYTHIRNILVDLNGFTYTGGTELFDGSQGGNDAAGDPTASMVVNALNEGRGIINYVGHGSDYAFVTTGFGVSNMASLTNVNMLPFVFSVACVNGNFHGQTCFAEAFMRANKPEGPTGAIAVLASTINQSWAPPMAGQDEMNDILVESYENNIKRTFGAIAVNGCMLMNDEYGADGDEMTDTWTCFGDPSVMVFTATPQAMTVSHPQSILLGYNQLMVTCDAENATVALTRSGQILASGKIEAGSVTLNFEPILDPAPVTLTVTAFNHLPYIAELQIIPANISFIAFNAMTIIDAQGNNNGLADYDETIDLNVALKNIGLVPAKGVDAVLQTEDSTISILSSTFTYGDIDSNEVKDGSAFRMVLPAFVPDGYLVRASLNVTDDSSHTWNPLFSFRVNAPKLSIYGFNVNDTAGNSNNRLDPGETVTLSVTLKNEGHAATLAGTCMFTASSSFIQINAPSLNVPAVAAGEQIILSYEVTISEEAPIGFAVSLGFNFEAGEYEADYNTVSKIGLIIEDWESNTFESFPWAFEGTGEWTVVTPGFEGIYAAKSGTITDNQSVIMKVDYEVSAPDTISFYYKTSSESNYDYLKFYIDNAMMGQWSGENGWTLAKYPVSEGQHTFKWEYMKDFMVTSGEDCAWVDAVEFPAGAQAMQAPEFISSPVDSIGVHKLYEYTVRISGSFSAINAAEELPSWITLTDNGNNTAVLTGTPDSIGVYQVSLSAVNEAGEAGQVFTITVYPVVSVDENSAEKISVYPNPASSVMNVYGTAGSELLIYTLTGVEVYKGTMQGVVKTINLSGFEAGCYILSIKNNKGTTQQRFVVEK